MHGYTSGKGGNDANYKLKQGCSIAKLTLVQEAFAEGASATASDTEGRTPLHWLARCSVFDPSPVRSIYDLLVAKGAPLDAIDNNGETPMNTAAQGSSMIMSQLFDDLVNRGMVASAKLRNQDGRSAMDGVVSFGDDGLLLRMLEAGISPRLSSEERQQGIKPALSFAWSSNGTPKRLARLLVAYGADVIDGTENDQYLTPLLAAVIVPKRLTELLESHNAQVDGTIPYAIIEYEARKEKMDESVAICQAFRSTQVIRSVAANSLKAAP